MNEKRYRITPKGFESAEIDAVNAGKAKYKLWLRSASYTGYWKSFIAFCMNCKVKRLA